ncbi:hypothetical protein B0T20DRAFT_498780 [Sordaria brevicollis]|uniref:SWIM-type domain-containing protein n=1 Tax=Sordaria brevicollis TaxID=83679 RepID=A0AAE0PF38_SORBR|nr:hypothetical protein B0T20DRAFT_498780 [Sordaria brevicollis]
MDRVPSDYLPDDSDWTWTRFPNEILQTQCKRRGLSAYGDRKALQQRLLDHKQANVIIPRKGPWLMRPYTGENQDLHWQWRSRKHFISHVKDKSDAQVGLRKIFTVATRDQNGDYVPERPLGTVTFDRNPACTCVGGSIREKPCSHWLYVLRNVLRCPEPLLWQQSFLSSEIELIYRISPATRSRIHDSKYRQGDFCFVCFKDEHIEEPIWIQCTACGMPMDTCCYDNFLEARNVPPKKEGQCIVCLDKAHWDVEKYREQHDKAHLDNTGKSKVTATAPGPVESHVYSTIEAEIPKSASPSRSSSPHLSYKDDSGSNWSDCEEDCGSSRRRGKKPNKAMNAKKNATASPCLPLRCQPTAKATHSIVFESIHASPASPTRPVNGYGTSMVQVTVPGGPANYRLEKHPDEQPQGRDKQQQQQHQVRPALPVIRTVRESILPDLHPNQSKEMEVIELDDTISVISISSDCDSVYDPATSVPSQDRVPASAPFVASNFIPVQDLTTPPAVDVQQPVYSPSPSASGGPADEIIVETQAGSASDNENSVTSSGFLASTIRAWSAVVGGSRPQGPVNLNDGREGVVDCYGGDVNNDAVDNGPSPDWDSDTIIVKKKKKTDNSHNDGAVKRKVKETQELEGRSKRQRTNKESRHKIRRPQSKKGGKLRGVVRGQKVVEDREE